MAFETLTTTRPTRDPIVRLGRSRLSRSDAKLDVVFHAPAVSALLTSAAAPPAGGAERQVYLLARELARRGCRVGLICFQVKGATPDELAGVRLLLRPPSQGHRPVVGFMLEAVITMGMLLSVNTRVYVQRVAGYQTGLVGLAAKLRRRTFVYSSASVYDFDFQRRRERPWRDRLLYRLGLTLADRIVVQTPEQVARCRTSLGRDPLFIRSIAEPAPARTGNPSAFLWIGRAEAPKRPLDYVSLARALPEASFQMVLLPPARRWAHVAPMVQESAAGVPNLEVFEELPRAQLGRLMDQSVAIVSTSEYEGMPNVFLEAWARGVPTLALHHDPDGVIEREGLGSFAGGSLDRLAAQARDLWAIREDQELAQRCRTHIQQQHSVAIVADQWMTALAIDRVPSHREESRLP